MIGGVIVFWYTFPSNAPRPLAFQLRLATSTNTQLNLPVHLPSQAGVFLSSPLKRNTSECGVRQPVEFSLKKPMCMPLPSSVNGTENLPENSSLSLSVFLGI